MNTAITNPLHDRVSKVVLAVHAMLGRDEFGIAWIAAHRAEIAGSERPFGTKGPSAHGCDVLPMAAA